MLSTLKLGLVREKSHKVFAWCADFTTSPALPFPFESLVSWGHGKQECENSRNVSRVSVLITRKVRLARIPFIWTGSQGF